jgi:hypothetical protein
MLPAFRQHLCARFLPYPHQKVELFIKPLSTTTYARFPQFLQPGGALARGIDLLSAAGNRRNEKYMVLEEGVVPARPL